MSIVPLLSLSYFFKNSDFFDSYLILDSFMFCSSSFLVFLTLSIELLDSEIQFLRNSSKNWISLDDTFTLYKQHFVDGILIYEVHKKIK